MKLLKSGEISEQTLHKTVIEWFKNHPNIIRYVIHIPNEGVRTIRYGKHLKDLGMRPGVSDLFIALPRHGYHGAFIELKTSKGILSNSQKIFLEDMQNQGYYSIATYGLDSSLERISWYCLD